MWFAYIGSNFKGNESFNVIFGLSLEVSVCLVFELAEHISAMFTTDTLVKNYPLNLLAIGEEVVCV